MSDIYGRQKIYFTGAILQVIPCFAIYFIHDLNTMIALFVFIGTTRTATDTIKCVYIMEFIESSTQVIVPSIVGAFDKLTFVVIAIYF